MNVPMQHEMLGLAKLIAGWIAAGAKLEEIQERLAGANQVAADLLEGAIKRREAGEAYLKRNPAVGHGGSVMVKAEPAPAKDQSRNAK